MTSDAAEIILVDSPSNDALLVTGFGVAIPDDAVLTGIQFAVRRAALDGNAVDDHIQILMAGKAVGVDHASSGGWPTTLSYGDYGSASDTWGVAWTPADVRANGFGLSITPKYSGPAAGNERAYVDSVRVTVFFRTPCD
jgi:hypothetical protein